MAIFMVIQYLLIRHFNSYWIYRQAQYVAGINWLMGSKSSFVDIDIYSGHRNKQTIKIACSLKDQTLPPKNGQWKSTDVQMLHLY
jgi:hypothetical protein